MKDEKNKVYLWKEVPTSVLLDAKIINDVEEKQLIINEDVDLFLIKSHEK